MVARQASVLFGQPSIVTSGIQFTSSCRTTASARKHKNVNLNTITSGIDDNNNFDISENFNMIQLRDTFRFGINDTTIASTSTSPSATTLTQKRRARESLRAGA